VENTELRAHGKYALKEREKLRNMDIFPTKVSYTKIFF